MLPIESGHSFDAADKLKGEDFEGLPEVDLRSLHEVQ